MNRRRGSSMLEGALMMTTFVIVMVGVIDFARLGYTYNSITYAAHQAARYASTSGSSSGHIATVANIQANAQGNMVGLDAAKLTVTPTWTPNNSPGSTVQVVVSYAFQPLVIPIAAHGLTLRSTAVDIITQ
jgi:Flp pilus assembly protein TadG